MNESAPLPPRVNPELPFPADLNGIFATAADLNRMIGHVHAFRHNPTLNDVGAIVGILGELVCMGFGAAVGDSKVRAILLEASLAQSFWPAGQLIAAAAAHDPELPADYREHLRRRLADDHTWRPAPVAGADGPFRLECSRGCGCAIEAPDKGTLASLMRTWEYRPHGHYTCPACSDAEGQAHAVQEQGAAALHVRQSPGDGQGVRGPHGLQEAAGAGEGEGHGSEHSA